MVTGAYPTSAKIEQITDGITDDIECESVALTDIHGSILAI